MNPSKPTKEGNLNKYRSFLKGWKERYFKLERSYLHYFETQYSAAPLGSITRGDISLVKGCNAFPGQPYVFELHTKTGLIWYLQAASQEEMVAWMRILYPSGYFVDPPTKYEGAVHNPTQPVVSGVSIPPVQPSQRPGYQPTTTTQSTPGMPVLVGPAPQGTHPQNFHMAGSHPQGTCMPRHYVQGANAQVTPQGSCMHSTFPSGEQTWIPHPQGPIPQGMYRETNYRLYPRLNGHEGTPPFNPHFMPTQGPDEPHHSSPPPSYEESAQAPPLPSKS